jgi:isocitrate/isopropylmalate dehydrogenase
MLFTSKLMLDWLKETEMATRLEGAIARGIEEGKVRTYDMSGRRGDTDSSGGEGGKDSALDVA